MNRNPTFWDVLLLSSFVILITFQPFFLHHEIIMMETGIHLPALNALFHGQIPYKDFYFLRGPLELYVPAGMMLVAGKNAALLPLFYYGGTVLTFLFCVLVGKHLFRTRWILYIMIPVLIARTFPRVSYYYWGGMRYAIGFLALWLGILFFKSQKRRWIYLAGLVSCLAFLTTVEAGVSVIFAFVAALGFAYLFQVQPRNFVLKSAGFYVLGFLSVLMPYLIYIAATNSLMPFLESMYAVVRFNHVAYPGEPGVRPETFLDFLGAFYPGSRYFKYMTPAFCYLFFAVYLVQKIRRKELSPTDAFLVGVAGYGLVLYAAAFRKIEGHHFEMALQPEKFLLFFMFEEVWLYFKTFSKSRLKSLAVQLAVCFFIAGSIGYAIQRYDHRFAMFKWIKKEILHQAGVKGLSLLENMESETLHLKRVDGITVPKWQAEEIRGVVEFLEKNTSPDEKVFTYPELGNFNFYADRPFVGRFPIVTFTWMYQPWHEELFAELKKSKPQYVIMTNLGHRTFPHVWYFRNPKNKERFEQFTRFILDHYEVVKVFESVSIYRLKPQTFGAYARTKGYKIRR